MSTATTEHDLVHEVEVLTARLTRAQGEEQRAYDHYAECAKALASGDENADIASAVDRIERSKALVAVIGSQLAAARSKLDEQEGQKADTQRHEQAEKDFALCTREVETAKVLLHELQAKFNSLPLEIRIAQEKFFAALRRLEVAKENLEAR